MPDTEVEGLPEDLTKAVVDIVTLVHAGRVEDAQELFADMAEAHGYRGVVAMGVAWAGFTAYRVEKSSPADSIWALDVNGEPPAPDDEAFSDYTAMRVIASVLNGQIGTAGDLLWALPERQLVRASYQLARIAAEEAKYGEQS